MFWNKLDTKEICVTPLTYQQTINQRWLLCLIFSLYPNNYYLCSCKQNKNKK